MNLLPVLVLNFGEFSALQYCTGNFLSSDPASEKQLAIECPSSCRSSLSLRLLQGTSSQLTILTVEFEIIA